MFLERSLWRRRSQRKGCEVKLSIAGVTTCMMKINKGRKMIKNLLISMVMIFVRKKELLGIKLKVVIILTCPVVDF